MRKGILSKVAILALALALVALTSLAACAETEALFPIKEGELWGYMNVKGETVIEPQWAGAGDFRGEYATVHISDGNGDDAVRYDGIINRKGEYVVEPNVYLDEGYDGSRYGGNDGIIWAMDEDGKMGFFDVPSGFYSGTIYGMCEPWDIGDGLVCVCGENDLYGYVSRETGEVVIPCQYEYRCEGFTEGFACVYLDDEYLTFQLIDKTGAALVLPEGYEPYSTFFSNGLLAVKDVSSGLFGFANAKGEIAIPAVYEGAHDFTEGYAAVQKGGLWGHIDVSGAMICEPKFSFDSGYRFINGYAVLNDNGTSVVINTKGDELFRMEGMTVGYFNENGVASYNPQEDYESFGVVDITGKVLLPADSGYRFEYTYAYNFQSLFTEGYQVLSKDGLFGYIYEKGNVAIDFVYDYAENFCDGLAYVRTKGDKPAYINHAGEIVWSAK